MPSKVSMEQLREITDRLARQEAAMAEIWQNVPIGLALFDSRGWVVEANPAFRDLFGIGDLPVEWEPLVHPDDVQKTKRVELLVQTGRHISGYKNRILTPSGEFVSVSWTMSRTNGHVYCAVMRV